MNALLFEAEVATHTVVDIDAMTSTVDLFDNAATMPYGDEHAATMPYGDEHAAATMPYDEHDAAATMPYDEHDADDTTMPYDEHAADDTTTPYATPYGLLTLNQYVKMFPYVAPYVHCIHPEHCLKYGASSNPFLIMPMRYFDEPLSATEYRRDMTKHENHLHLVHLGLHDGPHDDKFYMGVKWKVPQKRCGGAKQKKKKQLRAPAEVRAKANRAAKKRERQRSDPAKEERKQRQRATTAKECGTANNITETCDVESGKGATTHEVHDRPWHHVAPPDGLAVHPHTKEPLRYVDLPHEVRDALKWFMKHTLFLCDHDTLTGEMLFAHVSRYRARPILKPGMSFAKGDTKAMLASKTDFTKRQWRAWQAQRQIPGTQNFQGLYKESVLAALVVAATYVDPRIDTKESALAWVTWLVAGGDAAARLWLADPVVVDGMVQLPTVTLARRGRPRASTLAEDYELLASGYVVEENPVLL